MVSKPVSMRSFMGNFVPGTRYTHVKYKASAVGGKLESPSPPKNSKENRGGGRRLQPRHSQENSIYNQASVDANQRNIMKEETGSSSKQSTNPRSMVPKFFRSTSDNVRAANANVSKKRAIPHALNTNTEHDYNDEWEAPGSVQLYDAARNGDIRTVRELLKKVRVRKLMVESPMHRNHSSALYGAVLGNHADIVKLLLEEGCSPDHGSTWGSTPLFVGAQRDHVECVRLLLSANADVEKSASDKVTPLMVAVRWNNLATVKLLLAAGANIQARDVFGASVFDSAPKTSRTFKWLRRTRDYTALHFACLAFMPRRIEQLLLQDDTDPAAKGANGFTALDVLKFSMGSSVPIDHLRQVCRMVEIAQGPYSSQAHAYFPTSFQEVVHVILNARRKHLTSRNEKYSIKQLSSSIERMIIGRKHPIDPIGGIVKHLDWPLIEKVLSYCSRDWFAPN